jgi:hypothetical protein
MKKVVLVFVTLVAIFLASNISKAQPRASERSLATATPKPAPPPTLVFYTGDSIDTLQYFAPKKNNICITWNDLIGRIGPYFLPRGKSPIVIKFLEDQAVQPIYTNRNDNHDPNRNRNTNSYSN